MPEEEQMTEPWDGSGAFEGSSDGGYPYMMADKAALEPEAGSGRSLTVKDDSNRGMWKIIVNSISLFLFYFWRGL